MSLLSQVLMVALIVIALFQHDTRRFYAAFVFAGLTVLHDPLFGDLDGLAYYGSAALTDLLILTLLAGVYPVPKMVISLQFMSIVSVILNGIGYVMWFNWMVPTVYNSLFIVFYVCSILVMLGKDGENVGIHGVYGWRSCFRFYTRARNSYLFRYKDKV